MSDVEITLRRHGIFPQNGGGIRCDVKKGTVTVGGHSYRYTCNVEDDTTLIFRGGNTRPCFVLHIYPQTKRALLADVTRVSHCSINTDAPTQFAGLAAFMIAKDRGVKYIELTDNSSKLLPSGNKFSVTDMEFLTSGVTWYETFLPIQPKPQLADIIPRWRDIVRTNTWDKVISCLRADHPDIVIPVDIHDIDTTAPGSAMAVLRRIKDAKTDFFADYRWVLPKCSGISSLYGSEWEAYM